MTASRPKWHGTINSNVFNLIFSVLMYRVTADDPRSYNIV